jgi:hypothetical protein
VRYAYFDGDGDGVACEDLPGRPVPTTTPPPLAVPTMEDVIEPTLRYYGIHTREAPFWMTDFDQFAADAGKTPNLDMFFTSLGEPFPDAQVDALWARGVLPVITFEPIVHCSSDPAPLPDYDCTRGQPTLADIAAGTTLLEQQGAGNVAWFWSVNRVDNQKDPSVAKYYPGDAIQYSAEMTAAFGAGVADPRYGNGAPPVG